MIRKPILNFTLGFISGVLTPFICLAFKFKGINYNK